MEPGINTTCPWCGEEIESYFMDSEQATWAVIQPLTHSREWACQRGCTEIVETKDMYCACDSCGREIRVECVYARPCNANGYIVTMGLFREPAESESAP
jgi:hypothetical protein